MRARPRLRRAGFFKWYFTIPPIAGSVIMDRPPHGGGRSRGWENDSSGGGIRTRDFAVMSRARCQLRYPAIKNAGPRDRGPTSEEGDDGLYPRR